MNEDLRTLIDQVANEPHADLSPQEREVRFALLDRLFTFYGERSKPHVRERLEVYIAETEGIPLDKLLLAVRVALRAHVYPSLPSIADLTRLARAAAGMDREQYHAGRYLPPPREWPPTGQRYAVTRGELEALPVPHSALLLAPGAAALLLATGEGAGE